MQVFNVWFQVPALDLSSITMLEITARVVGRSVFLAGETITCHVIVANVVQPGQDKTNGSIGANAG